MLFPAREPSSEPGELPDHNLYLGPDGQLYVLRPDSTQPDYYSYEVETFVRDVDGDGVRDLRLSARNVVPDRDSMSGLYVSGASIDVEALMPTYAPNASSRLSGGLIAEVVTSSLAAEPSPELEAWIAGVHQHLQTELDAGRVRSMRDGVDLVMDSLELYLRQNNGDLDQVTRLIGQLLANEYDDTCERVARDIGYLQADFVFLVAGLALAFTGALIVASGLALGAGALPVIGLLLEVGGLGGVVAGLSELGGLRLAQLIRDAHDHLVAPLTGAPHAC